MTETAPEIAAFDSLYSGDDARKLWGKLAALDKDKTPDQQLHAYWKSLGSRPSAIALKQVLELALENDKGQTVYQPEQITSILEACCGAGHERKRTELLTQMLQKQREGPVVCQARDGQEFVAPLGQYFTLIGMDEPAQDICRMLRSLEWAWTHPAKFRTSLQILRMILAPGMGKSTALSAIWPLVVTQLKSSSSQATAMRAANSFNSSQALLCIIDFSTEEMRTLHYLEKHLNPSAILASRMLHALTSPAELKYDTLLRKLVDGRPHFLEQILPAHILSFLATRLQLQGPHHIIVGFDELNGSHLGSELTQDLLSSAVDMRESMQKQASVGLDIMPVIVTASTRAASTQMHQSRSSQSRYADVQLRPLGRQEMAEIAEDLFLRLAQDGIPVQSTQDLMPVLSWLGGVPRLLSWALCGLSGHLGSSMVQEVFLTGKALGITMDRKEQLLQDLTALCSNEWRSWMFDDLVKSHLLAMLLANAMLMRPVARSQRVVDGLELTYGDLECDNMISLVSQGSLMKRKRKADDDEQKSQPSPDSTASAPQWQGEAQALAPETDSGQVAPDILKTQVVSLHPLLVAASSKDLKVQFESLVSVPMLQKLRDDWRSREMTDIAIIVIKLALLKKVCNESTTRFHALYPACPPELRDQVVKIPQAGFDVHQVKQQLSQEEFLKNLSDSMEAGKWAFLGSGNDEAVDSWLALEKLDGKLLVIQIQSKLRTGKSKALSSTSLAQEATKVKLSVSQFSLTDMIIDIDIRNLMSNLQPARNTVSILYNKLM